MKLIITPTGTIMEVYNQKTKENRGIPIFMLPPTVRSVQSAFNSLCVELRQLRYPTRIICDALWRVQQCDERWLVIDLLPPFSPAPSRRPRLRNRRSCPRHDPDTWPPKVPGAGSAQFYRFSSLVLCLVRFCLEQRPRYPWQKMVRAFDGFSQSKQQTAIEQLTRAIFVAEKLPTRFSLLLICIIKHYILLLLQTNKPSVIKILI